MVSDDLLRMYQIFPKNAYHFGKFRPKRLSLSLQYARPYNLHFGEQLRFRQYHFSAVWLVAQTVLNCRSCLFEETSCGTLLMTASKKYQHCRVLNRGSKTGQQIDAAAKYVTDYKYHLFYFIYIMFVNN